MKWYSVQLVYRLILNPEINRKSFFIFFHNRWRLFQLTGVLTGYGFKDYK